MKYGYARVSTEDQNPAMQLAALKKAGCKTVFKDEVTGAHVNRPALARCLKKLETGDTLIVWKLDRPSRSLRDLITMLDDFRSNRAITATASVVNPIPCVDSLSLPDGSAVRQGGFCQLKILRLLRPLRKRKRPATLR